MVNIFSTQCNTSFENIQDFQSSYNEYVLSLHKHIDELVCPECGRRGSLTIKTEKTYHRQICNSVEQVDNPVRLCVCMAECSHCGRCHALLPEWIVPFFAYTVSFLYSLLSYYFSKDGNESKCSTARKFHLSRRTVGRLITNFTADWLVFRESQTFQNSPEDCEATQKPDPSTTIRRIIHHCTLESFRTFLLEVFVIAQHFILNEAFTHILWHGKQFYRYGPAFI